MLTGDVEVGWPEPDTQDIWQRMWRAYDGACNPASFANLDRRFHYARGVSWALDRRGADGR